MCMYFSVWMYELICCLFVYYPPLFCPMSAWEIQSGRASILSITSWITSVSSPWDSILCGRLLPRNSGRRPPSPPLSLAFPLTAHRQLAPARGSLLLWDFASVNVSVPWNALDHHVVPPPLQPMLPTKGCVFALWTAGWEGPVDGRVPC